MLQFSSKKIHQLCDSSLIEFLASIWPSYTIAKSGISAMAVTLPPREIKPSSSLLLRNNPFYLPPTC